MYEAQSYKGVYDSQNPLYQKIDAVVTLKANLADPNSGIWGHFT